MADTGRPLKFDSPEQLAFLIDEYFDSISKTKINDDGLKYIVWSDVPSMAGLAIHCGCNKDTLTEYMNNRPEFSVSIKTAVQRLEAFKVSSLYTVKNPAGCIFDLKNNHGWKDAQTVDMNVTGDVANALSAARQRAKE